MLKLRKSTVLAWGRGDLRRCRRPRIFRTVVEVCTSTSCMRHGIAKSVHHYWILGRDDNWCFIQNAYSQAFSRAVDSSPTDGSAAPAACPPWGFEASIVRHRTSCTAPCAPHASGPVRSAEGIVWVWQVPESHDGSSAPLSVPRGTCIRNSTKRSPLYYPLRSGTGLCHTVGFRRGPSKYSPTNRDSQDLSA